MAFDIKKWIASKPKTALGVGGGLLAAGALAFWPAPPTCEELDAQGRFEIRDFLVDTAKAGKVPLFQRSVGDGRNVAFLMIPPPSEQITDAMIDDAEASAEQLHDISQRAYAHTQAEQCPMPSSARSVLAAIIMYRQLSKAFTMAIMQDPSRFTPEHVRGAQDSLGLPPEPTPEIAPPPVRDLT